MVEIGGKPILWHIMKIYSTHGINDFIICLGYKGYSIKEYFSNYYIHASDVTFDMHDNSTHVHANNSEPWTVTLIETGLETMVGGRIKRVLPYLKGEEYFCLTYGDGVADIDLTALIHLHRRENRLATVTAVQPAARFGAMKIDGNRVVAFKEKPQESSAWINGGFFVLSPEIGAYIEDDRTVWEREPMERLAAENQLSCYRHHGFWRPMDTLRDKQHLENLWQAGKAPWKVW